MRQGKRCARGAGTRAGNIPVIYQTSGKRSDHSGRTRRAVTLKTVTRPTSVRRRCIRSRCQRSSGIVASRLFVVSGSPPLEIKGVFSNRECLRVDRVVAIFQYYGYRLKAAERFTIDPAVAPVQLPKGHASVDRFHYKIRGICAAALRSCLGLYGGEEVTVHERISSRKLHIVFEVMAVIGNHALQARLEAHPG